MFLSVPEACEHLRISRTTLTKLLAEGEIEGHRTGDSLKSRWRISIESINAYIERKTIKPVGRP